MDRLACVSIPALPLQLLLRCHPEWAICPVAVVAEDRPQGLICYVNAPAHKAGVRPGLRYAAGCSLTTDLRAGVIFPAEIDEVVETITKRLRRFTPEVEPSVEEPGVFWLNGTGLTRLYASYEAWARLIATDLNRAGFRTTVVVGFTRFGTYAVARARNGIAVFNDPVDERTAARQVHLECLELNPNLLDTLAKLGVTTIGSFLALPAGGLLTRFGKAAYRLHRMASGELWTPLQPLKPEEPIRRRLLLDDPETDAMRLLFRLKGLLHPLLKALAVRGEALIELTLRLQLDGGIWREERVCPAAPTLDPVRILDLVRLRLEAVDLPGGVIEIELTASSVLALAEQHRLIVERPRRDLEAANRALARIRATFGNEAVGRVRLADGHLPEASFRWEPLKQGSAVSGQRSGPESAICNPQSAIGRRSLVRRIFSKPVPLHLPPNSTLHGPYIISGGWWGRETHRDYYFAETRHGELLWVYYDRNRRWWYLRGMVE
ncbi:MAG: DNA polymerase Y family protein [bacterium]|uniref:DNA polymerase Y family protein n=1 Tax=Candidatus Methylomirabilis tolerans TaxID=3123416 RepID=A0AAJ1AGJ5_9BACT|nr:DNA polymerase Y family protein [Candidatus Methylomirabilis sp.]